MKIILFLQDTVKKGFQALETIIRVLLLSKWRVKIPGRLKAEDCVILGNGPSLKRDLQAFREFISGKDLVCVNHFPSSDLYEKLKPCIFVTTAPDLWLDDIDERFVKQSKILFDNLAKKTTWPLEFYIPFEAFRHKRWLSQLSGNKNIEIKYFNNIPVEGWAWFKYFCFSRKWGMPRPHNVMIPSLMICLWKKYKNMYLLGADHSWLSEISVTEKNEVLIHQKHFYDEHSSKGLPLDKRGKGKRNLSELLHKFMTAFASYFEIRHYSDHLGRKIYNATKGSFIDAFERIDLTELKNEKQ